MNILIHNTYDTLNLQERSKDTVPTSLYNLPPEVQCIWSFKTGSFMAVVSQDRFHCGGIYTVIEQETCNCKLCSRNNIFIGYLLTNIYAGVTTLTQIW